MGNIIFNVGLGEYFVNAAIKAKEYQKNYPNQIVEFNFNGVRCLVNEKTNIEWLYRDHCNAHTMGWDVVGAECVEIYDDETKLKLQKREEINRIREEAEQKDWELKLLAKKKEFNDNVRDIKVELIDVEKYNEWLDNQNGDSYGLGCFDYAMNWAKLMQKTFMDNNIIEPKLNDIVKYADKCSHDADIDGITGFMYGVAVSILSNHWKYGELLRKWHNKEFGDENSDGVINPAILTIKK